MLNPAAWEHWLTPAVALGVLVGSLAPRVGHPAPAIRAGHARGDRAALVIARDAVRARPPVRARAVRLFNGPYGHLLNFNGLTHTVLLLWPAVASAFLFALAGRPGWGKPD